MDAHSLADVDVIREGERDGSRTVLRVVPLDGPSFHAVAVPQDWYSYTGPTWIYIVEAEDGLTLIDAGSSVVVDHLSEAFPLIGMEPASIDKVIISHGHLDHDGGSLALAREWQVEVWAHALWARLRFHDRSELAGDAYMRVREAVDDDRRQPQPLSRREDEEERVQRRLRYMDMLRSVNLARLIEHGEQAAGLTFYHTPGHAPDEMTIQRGTVVFAGDHILPEISPHPTTKSRFPSNVRDGLPERYQDEDRLYGLDVYLRSLMLIAAMGEEALVMPAHRLINRGKLNLLTAKRAREIADHHFERVTIILDIMGTATWALGDLTKALFKGRLLQNVYEAALHETMAHLELLMRCRDVAETPEHRFVWNGSQHYQTFLDQLGD